jgi:glucose-1-phosphate thymidylyltransferase
MSKQLLPIYNKPMIYYPLSILLLAGIRDILVISSPADVPTFKRLFGDGSQWGVRFSYDVQDQPRGTVEALLIGREFIGDDAVCLIFGDNILYGHGVSGKLKAAAQLSEGALIFAYAVGDPHRFGIVEFDEQGKALSLEEKPAQPKSNYAVPGVYFYDRHVSDYAAQVRPSVKNELVITDLNRIYLEQGKLQVDVLGRGVAWLDAGTHASLLEASNFVQAVEHRQGLMISCPEEIAYQRGYISADQVRSLAREMGSNEYSDYLLRLANDPSLLSGLEG